MPMETMTPKERWLAVLQRKTPDRVPMDYWGTNETMDKLKRYLGCADTLEVYHKLHIDYVVSVSPKYAGPPLDDDRDMFGCGFRQVTYDGGFYKECVFHPLPPTRRSKSLRRIQWRCRGMDRAELKRDFG